MVHLYLHIASLHLTFPFSHFPTMSSAAFSRVPSYQIFQHRLPLFVQILSQNAQFKLAHSLCSSSTCCTIPLYLVIIYSNFKYCKCVCLCLIVFQCVHFKVSVNSSVKCTADSILPRVLTLAEFFCVKFNLANLTMNLFFPLRPVRLPATHLFPITNRPI